MAYGNSANNVSDPTTLLKVIEVFDSGNTSGDLRDYLQGSLPYPVVNAYANVASSGTLLLDSLASANNPPAIIPQSAIFLQEDSIGGDATTSLSFYSSRMYGYEGGASRWAGGLQWLYAGDRRDFDIRFTVTSNTGVGVKSGPTVNTWHNLYTTRSWDIYLSGGSFKWSSWGGTLEIRMNASPQTVISNTVFTMSCSSEL